MRRSALLGTMVLPTVLLLGGCSGLGKFFGDTITLPGMNPNLPYGLDENSARVLGRHPDESPILPEPGNVWPGPPQPLPTLNQVSREQGSDLSGALGSSGNVGNGSGPALHDGGSMSMGESDAISHGAISGADSFAGSGVLEDHVPDASSRYRAKTQGGTTAPIIIPNGDGTSTVIEADGTVKTIKTPPK